MTKTTQEVINGIVWKACDTFRTTMDSSQYKDYILTMFDLTTLIKTKNTKLF